MSNFLACNKFKSTKKRITFNVKIKVFKVYYSFLNHIKKPRFLLLDTLFRDFLRNHISRSASFKGLTDNTAYCNSCKNHTGIFTITQLKHKTV